MRTSNKKNKSNQGSQMFEIIGSFLAPSPADDLRNFKELEPIPSKPQNPTHEKASKRLVEETPSKSGFLFQV